MKMLLRYPADFWGGIISLAIMYVLFFSGARYLAGPGYFGERLDAVVVSLIAWSLATGLVFANANRIQEGASTGILEQYVLTRPGLLRLSVAQSLVLVLQIVLPLIPLVAVLVLVSGAQLKWNVWMLFPLMTIPLAAMGVGLAYGGWALLQKRLGQWQGPLQFVLLAIFLVRFDALGGFMKILGYILPMIPSVSMLRAILALVETPGATLIGVTLLNTAVYLGLGIWIFQRSLEAAKKGGVLGIY